MSTDGRLYVERKSDRDIKMRDLYLRVDDESEVTLRYGESVEIPLPAGTHRLKATNHIYSEAVSFTIGPGEVVRYEGVNVAKSGVLNAIAIVSGTVMYRPELHRI